jgi:hypothetical protein
VLSVSSDSGVLNGHGVGLSALNLLGALNTARARFARPVRGLDLGGNHLAQPGMAELARWLQDNAAPQLGSLSLWRCGLDSLCGIHVATILTACPALRELRY